MSECRAWPFINLHCESCICLCARGCSRIINLCNAPEISHTLGCGRLWAQWQKPLYAPRCEMSPRCTEGDSLAPRCSAAVYHKWPWNEPRAASRFCSRNKKKSIRNRTITPTSLQLDEFILQLSSWGWSYFRPPQVSAIADAVSWAREARCDIFRSSTLWTTFKAPLWLGTESRLLCRRQVL